MPAPSAPYTPSRRLPRLRHLLPAFALAAILLGLGLYNLHAHMRQLARETAAEMLLSVAALKSEEIQRWLEDRLTLFAEPPGGYVATRFEHLLQGGDAASAAALENRLRHLRETIPELKRVWLYDRAGRMRLGDTPEHPHGKSPDDDEAHVRAARVALETGKPQFIDLHRVGTAPTDVAIEILVPLVADTAPDAPPIGYGLYEITPALRLFPLLALWPTASPTAESLLVRRDGDFIENVSPLRHGHLQALQTRLPADTPDMIAAQALRTGQTIVEGIDYRGEPGLAAALKVPGTDWLLVAKMDKSEIYAETNRTLAWVVGASLLLLAAMVALARSALIRQQAETRVDLLARDVARLEEAAARARVEESLAESERSFKTLTEQIPAIIYRAALDASSQTLYVSPRVAELGYAPEEWIADPTAWERALHPDDRDRVLRELADFHARGGTLSLEYRMRDKRGEWRHFSDTGEILRDATGKPLYLQGMMIDVTELRRTERELRAALQVVEASPVVSFRWRADTEGWPIDYVSPNVARWGYRPEDLRAGRPAYAEMVHPDDLPRIAEEVGRHTAEGTDEYSQEYRLRTADGRWFWVQDSTRIVRDAAGRPRYYEGVVTDIDEKKRNEEFLTETLTAQRTLNKKLEEAHNQLLQSEKMASIGQLAAGVAHELNNPIGFVGSNLGTLDGYLHDLFAIADACSGIEEGPAAAVARMRQLKADKDYDFLRSDTLQLVTESREGLSRVAKIVKDLKDFSRAGEAVWQWADLHQGLDSTLNIVWNELKYKCTVTKEYGALPQVHCIPSQLNQVFMNLLVNAAHAIPDKGEITIRTGQQGDEVFVAVSDTGAGIAPEILNRIFDPFFTTKPVGKGTGLGLSLSYSIVQKHKGRIEVVSQPGSGTTFTVWLPIDPAPEESAVPPEPTLR
jgi:PAS domain S-box-containing protein